MVDSGTQTSMSQNGSAPMGVAGTLEAWGVGSGGLSATDAAARFALGVIVALVPDGLPATMPVALAVGVRRMARRKALIKSWSRWRPWVHHGDLYRQGRRAAPRIEEFPFDADRKLMTTVHRVDDTVIAYVKGHRRNCLCAGRYQDGHGDRRLRVDRGSHRAQGRSRHRGTAARGDRR